MNDIGNIGSVIVNGLQDEKGQTLICMRLFRWIPQKKSRRE